MFDTDLVSLNVSRNLSIQVVPNGAYLNMCPHNGITSTLSHVPFRFPSLQYVTGCQYSSLYVLSCVLNSPVTIHNNIVLRNHTKVRTVWFLLSSHLQVSLNIFRATISHQFVPRCKHFVSVVKTSQLMLYRETMVV